MALQGQWGLNETVNSVFSVSRSLLEAASTDNVQPLALMACEQFGNTLAMCDAACQKIELSVVPTPPSATIGFLRAAVGYSANDCTAQLGRTAAGVRFLGLACPLASTIGTFRAAQSLGLMLQSSAADATLLPANRQLKDLLAAIEPRSHNTGFADTLEGWHELLFKEQTEHVDLDWCGFNRTK